MNTNKINWKRIQNRIGARNITAFAKATNINYPTLYNAMTQQGRSLQPKHRKKILETLVAEFKSSTAMISWLDEDELFFSIPPDEAKAEKSFIKNTFRYKELLSKFNVPKHYLRRYDFENQLLDAVIGKEKNNEHQGIVITGIGGSGKTTFAKASVRRAIQEHELLETRYDDIYWINCEKQQYDDIIMLLAVECGTNIEKHIEVFVRKALERKRILLVLDGLEDLEIVRRLIERISLRKSQLLITTRHKPDKFFLESTFLRCFDVPEGFSFQETKNFIKLETLSKKDTEAFAYLYEKTEGLPLAWTILSAIQTQTNVSWSSLKEGFDRRGLETIEKGSRISKHNSLYVSIFLSVFAVSQKSKTVQALLKALGLFTRNIIPIDLILQVYKIGGIEIFLESDLVVLFDYGLIEIEEYQNKRVVRIHPLTHEFMALQIRTPEFKEDYRDLVTIAYLGSIIGLYKNVFYIESRPDVRYARLLLAETINAIRLGVLFQAYERTIEIVWLTSGIFEEYGLSNYEREALAILERINPQEAIRKDLLGVRNYLLGREYLYTQQYSLAEQNLRAALSSVNEFLHWDTHLFLMQALFYQGKIHEIRKHLNELPQHETISIQTILAYVDLLILLQDPQNALDFLLKKSDQFVLSEEKDLFKLTQTFCLIELKEYDNTIHILTDMSKREQLPNIQMVMYFNFFRAHYALGEVEKATAYRDKFLALTKNYDFPTTERYIQEMNKILSEN